MKKLLLLFALLGMFTTACEELGPLNPDDDNQTETPDNGNGEGDVVDFDIDIEEDIVVGFEGGEVKVVVTTSHEYSIVVAEEAQGWLSVTKTSAEGVDTLTVTVAANESEEERSAEVTLAVDAVDFSRSFTITQLGLGDDIWTELGEGLYHDDFIGWLYGAALGKAAPVVIEESVTRPGYYRLLNLFSEENVVTFIGGIPRDITYSTEDVYIEIDARNPESVFIPYQPAGFTIVGMGEVWIAMVSSEGGKLVDGNISFAAKTIGLLLDGGSSGYYANTSGLFHIVLPGYPDNGKLQLRAPVLSVENVTDSGFTVTWEAVENADYYVVRVNESDAVVVDETHYNVEVPRKGVYTVYVYAASDDTHYLTSSTRSITQFYDLITPEECDWAECEIVAEPDKGVYVFCKGTGVVYCAMTVFGYDGSNAVDYSVSDLYQWSSDYWVFNPAEVNAEGEEMQIGSVVDIGYQVYIFMTHESGDTVLFKHIYDPANS